MLKLGRTPEVSTWSLTVTPLVQGDTRWRAQVVEKLRLPLQQRLERNPAAREFGWTDGLLEVRARHMAGTWRPGSELRLSYAGDPMGSAGTNGSASKATALATVALPDDRLRGLGERLVGLDPLREEVLLEFRCRWDRGLPIWSERTQSSLSAALRAQFEETAPLFIFAGDPGVGKSAAAQVIADRYCRQAEAEGALIRLGTEARGNGLVGDFSQRLRAAFEEASRRAMTGPVFLLIDEGDALAMRRSETHAHHEDRAGTATLLQCLDTLGGGGRLAVFLTTNLVETVDPAVLRRGTLFTFDRPDRDARRELLAQWLPGAGRKALDRAAGFAEGLTPADIERALRRACLDAVRADTGLRPELVIDQLRRQPRTERV